MKELKEYDKAASAFYRPLNLSSLPLNSWDSYAEHFHSVIKTSQDITVLRQLAKDHKWIPTLKFEDEILQNNYVVVLTDPQLKIVHTSQNMLEMNGYTSKEVLGKSPKMFQGEKTCNKTNQYISQAIKAKQPFEAILLNYRKDGRIYKCWIKGQPVFNTKNEVVHFIAYEKEVA